MSYEQAISYLYASTPAFHLVGSKAYKPGLDNTYALMEHLGNPHTKWQSVHIAGTNGKGSTSHLIAASLQCAGLKVGLYTSPHLVDFRERIRVLNGGSTVVDTTVTDQSMIPQEAVVRFVEENKTFLDQLRPSFFETAMAMAFWYFAEQQVDIAVIEVGLGGRLDSTNIITPLLSVITNIGMDHTEFLGDTLAQIAEEKAGIIKPHVPCVIGETDPETAPVFLAKAQECGIHIYFADQCEYLRRCRIRDIKECQLHGIYQEHNMQTAYVALRALSQQLSTLDSRLSPFDSRLSTFDTRLSTFDSRLSTLDFRLSTFDYKMGFAHVCTLTGLRGRWETLSQKPLTICDTGHNSHGIKYVCQQLQALLQQTNTSNPQAPCTLRMVFGMVSDKDVEVVMSLLPKEAVYYFTQANTQRAISAERMVQIGINHHLTGHAYSSVAQAIQAAQKEATDQDIIFIGGSNYVVGEALPLFN